MRGCCRSRGGSPRDPLPLEPPGKADLVVTALQIANADETHLARGKVTAPLRIRATEQNTGETTTPVTVVRLTACAGPLLAPDDRATPRTWRVDACVNATSTAVERDVSNNCRETDGELLFVQPNLEFDCAATAVQIGVLFEVNTPSRCRLGTIFRVPFAPTSVRFHDIPVTTRPFTVTMRQVPSAPAVSADVKVIDENGTLRQWRT
jgi:hypothetical protein